MLRKLLKSTSWMSQKVNLNRLCSRNILRALYCRIIMMVQMNGIRMVRRNHRSIRELLCLQRKISRGWIQYHKSTWVICTKRILRPRWRSLKMLKTTNINNHRLLWGNHKKKLIKIPTLNLQNWWNLKEDKNQSLTLKLSLISTKALTAKSVWAKRTYRNYKNLSNLPN